MPWKESRIVNERVRFVADVLRGERRMTELCQTYGIARKTGYKWVERFHVAGAANLIEQQERFLRFRDVYNNERPHEALDLATPASLYVCSPRPFPSSLSPIEYGPDFLVRRVKLHGEFKWGNEGVFLSTVLSREFIGFLPIDEDLYQVWSEKTWLGDFDAWTMKFNPRKRLY